jgi:hypothetical protein
MKFLKLTFALMLSLIINAQSVMDITYMDIPATEIGEFIEVHKQFTDITIEEGREMNGQWVYRHWYGSGASVVVMTYFDSAESAAKDDPWEYIRKRWENSSDEEKKSLEAMGSKYASFLDRHSDEVRTIDWENWFIANGDAIQEKAPTWDTNWVLVVGSYNSSGNWGTMANAYMDWQVKPQVEEGSMLAGGYSYHFSGSGSDVQFFTAYASLVEFAEAASSQGTDNPEARSTFWSLVEGGHDDQIYVHVGHVDANGFNLAGPNR